MVSPSDALALLGRREALADPRFDRCRDKTSSLLTSSYLTSLLVNFKCFSSSSYINLRPRRCGVIAAWFESAELTGYSSVDYSHSKRPVHNLRFCRITKSLFDQIWPGSWSMKVLCLNSPMATQWSFVLAEHFTIQRQLMDLLSDEMELILAQAAPTYDSDIQRSRYLDRAVWLCTT